MTSRSAPRRAWRSVALPIYWTSRAQADLTAIGEYIAQDNARAAERWVLRLTAIAEKAALSPMAGRRVPELGRDDVREVLLRSYRIVYRLFADRLEILTVFEGHRLLPETSELLEGEE